MNQAVRQEPSPEAIEAFRQKLLDNHRGFIERYGHTVQAVFDPSGESPSFAYTVGLYKHGFELFVRDYRHGQVPLINEVAERAIQASKASEGKIFLQGRFPSLHYRNEDSSSIGVSVKELSTDVSFELICSTMNIARAIVSGPDLAKTRILEVRFK